ncbi:MAG: diguanylate cyclase [Duganella sp.]
MGTRAGKPSDAARGGGRPDPVQRGDRSSAARIGHQLLLRKRAANAAGGRMCTNTYLCIALAPGDADTPDALMKNADLAMYAAKEAGSNRFNFFSRPPP